MGVAAAVAARARAALGVATDDGARPVRAAKAEAPEQRVKDGSDAAATGVAAPRPRASRRRGARQADRGERCDARQGARRDRAGGGEGRRRRAAFDGVAAYANIEKLVELATKLNGALLARRAAARWPRRNASDCSPSRRERSTRPSSRRRRSNPTPPTRGRAAAAILSEADAAAAAAERAAAERAAAAVAAVAAAAASEFAEEAPPAAAAPPSLALKPLDGDLAALVQQSDELFSRVKLAIALRAKAAAAAGDARAQRALKLLDLCAELNDVLLRRLEAQPPTVDAAAPLRRVRARREAMEALRARADGTAAAAEAAAAPAPADEEEGRGAIDGRPGAERLRSVAAAVARAAAVDLGAAAVDPRRADGARAARLAAGA